MITYFYFVVSYFLLLAANWVKMPLLIYIGIIMLPFSIVSYVYDPVLQQSEAGGEGVDLYRQFERLDFMRFSMENDFFTEAPLSKIYFQAIASLFDNNHALPLISMCLFYSVSFIAILSVVRYLHMDINAKKMALFVFICLFDFFSTMNNIRYPIATAIFVLILFFELVGKKINYKLFYVIPVLIHPGTMMFLIIRFLARYRLFYSLGILMMSLLFVSTNFESIIQAIINVFFFSPEIQDLLIAISFKAFNYSTNEVYEVPLLQRIMSYYKLLIYIIILAVACNFKCDLMRKPVFFRMMIILIILSFFGALTNFMDGVFMGRIQGVLPFMSAVLSVDIWGKIKKISSGFGNVIKLTFILISFTVSAVYLFKLYFNWIYLGL